jgi:hypothetical protein
MTRLKVDDIVRGRRDSTDAEILTVYAKVSRLYAIYKTAERVLIHFADDPAKGSEQRQALVPLSPVLGEINGLIDGWRVSPKPKLHAKAKSFDRRVADALLLGLQGHAAQAQPLLQEIKDDLLEERTSPARVDYAVVAGGVATLMVLIACLMTSRLMEPIYRYTGEAQSLWLGFGAGAVGALFFTCLRLRTRDLNTDLQPWENRADATARILIGALAGTVIVGLLQSELVRISLGDAQIPGTGPLSWVKVAVAGFLGGYSERLVTTVLDRAAAAGQRGGAQNLVGSAATTAVAGSGGTPSETNPLGRAPAESPQPAPAQGRDTRDTSAGEGDDIDGCGSDVEPDAADATDDVELPPAVGGVEQTDETATQGAG